MSDKIQEIFNNCDDECEGANYHSMIGLAENIFDSVKEYVRVDDYEAVAKAISKQVIKSI
jgi:hypothetical protein